MIGREDLFIKQGDSIDIRGQITDRNLKTAVNVFKANFIRKVLEENAWNQTEAARVLAIQRTYLSKLIKELKIC
jgi:Nif-specific regulatory protein